MKKVIYKTQNNRETESNLYKSKAMERGKKKLGTPRKNYMSSEKLT